MKRRATRAVIFRLLFYMGATAFILVVWQYQKHFSGSWIEPLVTSISPAQEKELDALLEMNRLITTLGTGLLGAMGFILVNGHKEHRGTGAFWAAFASAVCVGLSIFFGYVVYLGIIAMLQNQFFDLDNPGIWWARQAHFYTFLLGVVLFGDFAFQILHSEEGHERTSDVGDH